TLALGVAVAVSMITNSANANSLQNEMDKLFGEMSNLTPAGIYETQRRGVLAGGRYTGKTRVFDENIVSFAPPSWKAGCGGVDLFGGSLSFINSDQIVQLLRSVAANAKGYAFQLALDNVFPDGAKWIENFQKKVQALNQHLGNSCQLAQGIVNDVASGFDIKHKTDASLKGTTMGLFEDFFASNTESTGKTPLEELKINQPTEYQKLIGNIVWKQLKQNNANTWFQFGDALLLEAIMSITGTVIVGDLIKDPNTTSSDAKTSPLTILPGNKITLSDLIGGGAVDVYSCAGDSEQCLNAGTQSQTVILKGIQHQITDMLIGNSASPGIIYKYAHNQGTLNDQEKAFVANLPGGVGALIIKLSALSHDAADIFATQTAGALALAMMQGFINEFFRATQIAIANSQSPYKKEVVDLLAASQRQIASEYSMLSAHYGDLAEVISHYNHLIENVRKNRYMQQQLNTAATTN
ncbi:MAG: conjugal transfer protein TraH, partial [Shewanella sp.]